MDYLEILDSYKEEMVATLKDLISYPSVASTAVKTADGELLPFGKDVHEAFLYTLAKCEEMGLETFNADNYGGHAEWKCADSTAGAGKKDSESVAAGAETFAVAGHLDVVPAGSGWTYNPFEATISDGWLYGRGSIDDKGPLVASLYAIKALKEAGLSPQKNIRLIFGLDEETGFRGMNYYTSKAGQPDAGFTPDADFPLVNGEKGRVRFDLAMKLSKGSSKDGLRLTKVEAGTVCNAVPDYAKAVVAGDKLQYDSIRNRLSQYVLETGYKIKAKKQGSSLVIEAYGRTAHGARPELGLNAISILMGFLGRLQFANEDVNDFIYFYNDKIAFYLNGEKMGCCLSDEESGALTWNVGLAAWSEDVASVSVDVRFPVSYTSKQIYDGIEESLDNTNIGIVKIDEYQPIYKPLDDPMVEALMNAYREETGDTKSEALVLGGGTYAKGLNNTLAFGGLFPGEEDCMHQANERIALESFYRMSRIYAKALYLICFRAW